MDYRLVITLIFAGFALLELALGRFGDRRTALRRDAIIEIAGTLSILVVTVPAILTAGAWLVEAIAPGSAGAWAGLPVPLMFLMLLIGDDMTQYWWHRASHATPWLYNLHRAHHSAGYMSVRVVYRNNLFYYVFMPGLWISAALIHLGFGPVYAVYVVVKMTVVIAAHSSVRWDEWLYRRPGLSGLAWVLERTISTPATHSAHHGKHKADGVTHYKGNYGNLLFFWDVLFGTAHITRRYPEQYGLENLLEESWRTELAWPLAPMAADATGSASVEAVPVTTLAQGRAATVR